IVSADEAPAGRALCEHWLVTVLWISLSQCAREDSHADFRIIAEGIYQNSGRCRRRDLWPCCSCQSPGLQTSGSEETHTGRRPVSRPPEGERSLRELSLVRISQELRSGRGGDQRLRLVPHLYNLFPTRSRRACLAQFPMSRKRGSPPDHLSPRGRGG